MNYYTIYEKLLISLYFLCHLLFFESTYKKCLREK